MTAAKRAIGRVAVRPYEQGDRALVHEFLRDLPRLYPAGDVWLAQRLDTCLIGGPRCTLVECGSEVAALAIETPKANGSLKLSTFFVAPAFRRCGLGALLSEALQARWVGEGWDEVYVTCDESVHGALASLWAPLGFMTFAAVPGRYRQGSTEMVMRALLT